MKGEYDDELEDILYDEAVQRMVDDNWETEREAKRRASGLSMEQLTVLDAYVEGRKAGRQLQSSEMNPYPSGTAKNEAWALGRLTALGQITGRVA